VAAITQNVRSERKTAKGAETEFEAIFTEHYGRVYGLLFRLVGDQAEAEDLALETFWRFWEQPPTKHANVVGWLCRVALNLGYNALRSAKRRTQYETEAGRDALEQTHQPDPAIEAERNADRHRTRAVLRRMTAREAQLLILRHSGFAYREIADIIGVAPGSIGTLLARAEEEFERLYHETSH
jgi:RNA polymerase sigma-70 factor (ECF subfamily)